MRIFHRNGIPFFATFHSSFVPSCCKDYFLEKVLCMYQGSGEEPVLRLLSRALRTCYIKVSSPLQRKRSAVMFWGKIRMIVSLTSPATKLLSVRFHFVDNNLCSLII